MLGLINWDLKWGFWFIFVETLKCPEQTSIKLVDGGCQPFGERDMRSDREGGAGSVLGAVLNPAQHVLKTGEACISGGSLGGTRIIA